MDFEVSNIICVADMNISGALDRCLADLALPEVFVQRAKQLSLASRRVFPGFRSGTKLDESRALIYRMYIPPEYETGAARRIAEATDLKMGGRGSLIVQRISLRRGSPLAFDTEKLDRLCGREGSLPPEDHALITCIVSRGSGEALAEAALGLGICVPVIFFGSGVGMRDKLGLLRIAIPVEKEIIWFLVPRGDAELVEKTLIRRARLDIPGQGFLYKSFASATVANLRVRQGKRIHAATMEQVIAAMDEVRGSSDWRRLGPGRGSRGGGEGNDTTRRGLFFIGEEEEVTAFRLTAMANGARGATLNPVEMRSYGGGHGQAMVSHSRELCDIIIPRAVEENLRALNDREGLFAEGRTCVLKALDVEMPPVIRPGSK